MPGRPAARPSPARSGLAPSTLARRARSIRVTACVVGAVLAGGVAGVFLVGRAAPPSRPVGAVTPGSPASGSVAPGGAPPRTRPADVTVTTVTGTVTVADAAGATGPALTTPLEIKVPVRGQGGATFFDVEVGGRPSTIEWEAGEPLGLIGHGAIVPGPADVVVDASGATWSLDGARRPLRPGTYRAAAPVAVGQSGLAQAVDGADFTTVPGSAVETSGGATVHRSPAALHLVGSGPVSLTGALTVVTDTTSAGTGDPSAGPTAGTSGGTTGATRSVHTLRLGGGSYVIDLTPRSGRLTVRATLRGPAPVTTG